MMKTPAAANKTVFLFLTVLVFLSLSMTTEAKAASFAVTKTADTNDNVCSGADCSLREAIAAATATTADDTITFSIPASDAGCSNGDCTITLTRGELVLGNGNGNGSYTISNAAGAQSVCVSGNNQSRVFNVGTGENVTINKLTVTGGRVGSGDSNGEGGGIRSEGTLTIINSIISGNTANSRGSAEGGGIYSASNDSSLLSLTIVGSTIFGNSVSGDFLRSAGGGIYAVSTDLTITDSTISNNSAVGDGFDESDFNMGGGIFISGNASAKIQRTTISGNFVSGNLIRNAGGGGFVANTQTQIINCTVSGNFANGGTPSSPSENYGGGFYRNNFGLLGIVNSTIFGNSAANGNVNSGGGIFGQNGSTLNLTNNIVSGNNAASGADVDGTVTTSTNNIIGADARLAPLGFYGGSNYTHALLNGSNAINAGNSGAGTPRDDQRGAVRDPARDNLDIGAYELIGSFLTQLPAGSVGKSYSFTIIPETGSASVCKSSGALPPGLTGISNCPSASFAEQRTENETNVVQSPTAAVALNGTPTMGGTYNFSLRIVNGNSGAVIPYQIQIIAAPTAASISIGGLVLTPTGRGLRNATVVLTDGNGNRRTARTTAFGRYRFADVAAGETYIFDVKSKRYVFAAQVINLTEDQANINFTAVDAN